MNKLIFFLFFVIICHIIFYQPKNETYSDVVISRVDKIIDHNYNVKKLNRQEISFLGKYLSYVNCDYLINQNVDKEDSVIKIIQKCLHNKYQDSYYDTLAEEIKNIFYNNDQIKEDFQSAFKNYNNLLQDSINPQIIFFNGFFNYYSPFFSTGFILPEDNSYIGIALEMFLGRNHEFYKVSWLPQYLRDEFQKEYLVSRSMKCFLINQYGQELLMGERLIDEMLYWGKVHFVLNKILNNYHDTLAFGFTKKELDWCYKNEKRIWRFFIEEEESGNSILFSSGTEYFYKYINPAGHSKGMPSDSPGMIGRWLGYRIFSSYIKNKKFKIDAKYTSDLILNSKTYKPQ